MVMNCKITPDLHIPEKAPRIGIQSLDTVTDNTRVKLTGDPFHFGSFVPGDEFLVCDYDFPDEILTQVSRGSTTGPILFLGHRCTEIVTYERDARGNPLQTVRRLITPGNRFAKILLICLKRMNGMGSVEVVNLEFPLFIEPGLRWQVVRSSGKTSSELRAGNVERITSPVDLFLGKESFRCIRWLRPRTTGMGYREAEEIFIDVASGLTVLIRGFVGSDFPRLEQFQRSPQLEIAGEIFYLQYIRRIIR